MKREIYYFFRSKEWFLKEYKNVKQKYGERNGKDFKNIVLL